MPPRPSNPPGLPLASALDRREPLARLLQRLQESRARFEAVSTLLPAGLRAAVRPGPLDEEGWTLLADHGAAAAKLRQMLPRFEALLRERGWQGTPIKVRVQPTGQPPVTGR